MPILRAGRYLPSRSIGVGPVRIGVLPEVDMRLLAFAISCALATSWVGAGEASAHDYSGKYKSKITSPSGDVSKVTVTIKKIDETIYAAESKFGDYIETSICFSEEGRLSCGFAPKSGGGYVGVSVYEPDETGKLIGRWVETSQKQFGSEVLTPVAK